MSTTSSICAIQDLLDRWRVMGSRSLSNGVELIGSVTDGEDIQWMHVVYPAESTAGLDRLEDRLGVAIPGRLRAFYRACGGMSMFMGAFHLLGSRRTGSSHAGSALQPEGVVELNRELEHLGWKAKGAIAFASNSWDRSVHVLGMGRTPDEVVRCERQTGRVIERHRELFTCVEARVLHLDELVIR